MKIVRTLAISSLLAAVLIPIQSAPSFAQANCPNADLRPPIGSSEQDRAVRRQVASALACLLIAEHRNAAGATLRGVLPLSRAAGLHAKAAVEQKWWRPGNNPHVNPQTGSTIESRIRAQGYCSPKAIAQVAEITYNGSGSASTARATFNWWMNSPGHRDAIRNPSLRDFGLGYWPGLADPTIPTSNNMMTYVVTFGRCAP